MIDFLINFVVSKMSQHLEGSLGHGFTIRILVGIKIKK